VGKRTGRPRSEQLRLPFAVCHGSKTTRINFPTKKSFHPTGVICLTLKVANFDIIGAVRLKVHETVAEASQGDPGD